jgi:hypothetical protein
VTRIDRVFLAAGCSGIASATLSALLQIAHCTSSSRAVVIDLVMSQLPPTTTSKPQEVGFEKHGREVDPSVK